MCGLAGFWTSRSMTADALHAGVLAMIEPIAHRGPDDHGCFTDPAGVALGFRRLAIVDLSANGHQPMASASGRFTIIFNGEVYNHADIRRELLALGYSFRGHSDTEVMLAAFEEWGIKAALERFVGMFAIALWDRARRELTLARDRVGKKPLFVYAEPGLVSFASELKSLHVGPSFERSIDRDAVADYLRYLYIPGPQTIFRQVRKLEPGHFLTIVDPSASIPPAQAFWTLDDVRRNGVEDPFIGGDEEAVDALDALLRDAVRIRMEADVPLGAFLSGGIDSSTVVALMQAQSTQSVRTFSIGFDDARHDESQHAANVAAHLGTSHTGLLVTGRDALETVTRLPDIYDEPMADASQIPTLLVCTMARKHVTVAVSGDGGDEVFGGYNRYILGTRTLERLRKVPRSARRLLAAGIGSVGTDGWDRAYAALSPVVPAKYRQRLPGEKLHKLGRLMREESDLARYRSLVSVWSHPEAIVRGATRSDDAFVDALRRSSGDTLFHRMMFADQSTYLVENQMTKVDRASMATSLEVRVPILDQRVIEFSWRLPQAMKVRDGVGKWLLRQVLYRYVPRAILDRPKMGFSVPLGAWLRSDLRSWAEALLTTDALERDALLNAPVVQRAWQTMLSGSDENVLGLWAVLQLQQWRQRWLA